jgi:4-nitrophenyl phosphatase
MMNNDPPINNMIIDMDGVLWHGERPVIGLAAFFEQLRKAGIGFVLATNNARKIATQYSEKLAGFGVTVSAEQILTSAEAAATYLHNSYPEGAKAYVVGDSGLRMAMALRGFQLLNHDGFVGGDARADVVVVGFTPFFHYDHLASATFLINQGAAFIGTNPDDTFPTEYGPLPGAGSMLAFLETATGVRPTVLGKPNRTIFEQALRMLGGTQSDTVMVGDRLGTDIVGGHAAGLRTVMLLSGISDMNDVDSSEIKPTWILEDLAALTEFVKARNAAELM